MDDIEYIPFEKDQSNPSRWPRRIVLALSAGCASMIAAYLGLYQWRLIPNVWDPFFGVQSTMVLDSWLSHNLYSWFHVPDSVLGSLTYLIDVIFALSGSNTRWVDRPWLVILFGIAVFPTLIASIFLVTMQATLVGHWCTLCITSAAFSILLAFLAHKEVFSTIRLLKRVWAKSKDRTTLFKAIIGQASPIVYDEACAILSEMQYKTKR